MRTDSDGKLVLSIGFSPCPNDTYIFDALVNGKIDTGNVRFEPFLLDVQELNRLAIEGRLDITKISYRAYADCARDYLICDSGSALGRGVGPLLVARQKDSGVGLRSVAIPGENTTANFLFRLYYPEVTNRVEMLFSDIEDAVGEGKVDAGVIIHENRFTYADKGLVKVADLGALWEEETGQPIPLGGIVIKRAIDAATAVQIDSLIRKSVMHANADPSGTENYVKRYAQAMDPEITKKHIELYVNEYSVDLGEIGRSAIRYFFGQAAKKGILKTVMPEPYFVSEISH